MKHEFDTQLTITVAGVERELSLHVTGEYHRAQDAFTYRGEIAPTDPPEPASFELSEITLDGELGPDHKIHFNRFLSQPQVEAIEAEGLRDAQENG